MKREGPLHKKVYELKDKTEDTISQKTLHARVRNLTVESVFTELDYVSPSRGDYIAESLFPVVLDLGHQG